MEITQKVGIHNRFDIEVIDAKTGEIKQKAKAENVVLNNLFNYFSPNRSSNTGYFNYLFFGSGTGTPQKTDTQLFNHVAAIGFDGGADADASASSFNINYQLAQGYISVKRQVSISESQYVGVHITEVGIGNGTNATNLCTHAMLQDMNGNPISILKTNTDIITFYATVYVHTSQSGMLYLGSNEIWRGYYMDSLLKMIMGSYASDMTYYFNYIKFTKTSCVHKVVSTGYGGKQIISGASGTLTQTWDNTLKKYTITFPRVTISQANIGGIGGIWIDSIDTSNETASLSSGAWNGDLFFPVSQFYQGDNIVGEAVGTGDGTITRFKTKFDFPENAKVYVNGIEQISGVTVRRMPCNTIGSASAYIDYLLPETVDENHLLYYFINITSDGSNEAGTNGITLGSVYTNFSEWRRRNIIIKNHLYETGFGSAKFVSIDATITLYGSNDLQNWNLIDSYTNNTSYSNKTISLDSTTGHYKYYKATLVGGNSNSLSNTRVSLFLNSEDFKAIVFDTPPATGDVITVDYHTPYIAKDSDHVLDLTFSIQFGEYTPT